MRTGRGITLEGIEHEGHHLPVNLAAGIVAADIGKPLAIDTSAANTLKLVGDGEQIEAYLSTVEDRTVEGDLVGAAAFLFQKRFTYEGADPVFGDYLVGSATAGTVKKQVIPVSYDATFVQSRVRVVEVDPTTKTVVCVKD